MSLSISEIEDYINEYLSDADDYFNSIVLAIKKRDEDIKKLKNGSKASYDALSNEVSSALNNAYDSIKEIKLAITKLENHLGYKSNKKEIKKDLNPAQLEKIIAFTKAKIEKDLDSKYSSIDENDNYNTLNTLMDNLNILLHYYNAYINALKVEYSNDIITNSFDVKAKAGIDLLEIQYKKVLEEYNNFLNNDSKKFNKDLINEVNTLINNKKIDFNTPNNTFLDEIQIGTTVLPFDGSKEAKKVLSESKFYKEYIHNEYLEYHYLLDLKKKGNMLINDICGNTDTISNFLDNIILSYLYSFPAGYLNLSLISIGDNLRVSKYAYLLKSNTNLLFQGIIRDEASIDNAISSMEKIMYKISDEKLVVNDCNNIFEYNEISKIEWANQIFEAMCKGYVKYSDILDQSKVPSSPTLSDSLDKLIKMEVIEKQAPINDEFNKKKSKYLVKDNLTYFYFKYIFPNSSSRAVMDELDFYNKFIKDDLFSKLVPNKFENIFREFLIISNKCNKITPMFSKIGKFYYDDSINKKNEEFDVVTEDEFGFAFYEAKYKNSKITDSDILKEIEQVNKTQLKSYKYGFLSKSGYSITKNYDNVILYTIEDIYSI